MARQELLDRFGTILLLLLIGAIVCLLIYAFREEFDDREASGGDPGARSVSMRRESPGELSAPSSAAALRR